MIEIVRADITTLDVDAIVNAANTALRGGGGVDGAIHRAAGPALLEELKRYPGVETGGAVITRGHRLPARWVIHAVGPVWRGGAGEPALLERAYRSAFSLAHEHDVRSIAFPAISTGVYGYPLADATRIALTVMVDESDSFDRIVAAVFDERTKGVYEAMLGEMMSEGR